MTGKVACVLSDVRSGSTLFAQLLGAHSEIVSVGELQWLRAYVRNDRRLYNPPHDLLCACGRPITSCEFWQAVARAATRPLDELDLLPRFLGWIEPGAAETIPLLRRVVEKFPTLYKSRAVQEIYSGRRAARDSMVAVDAIFQARPARYVIDTSKLLFRFRSLQAEYPTRLKVIVLHRDYRAVVYSKMKRGASLEESAQGWALKVRQIKSLTSDIAQENVFQLKYEDLCTDTAAELTRVCHFLGLRFEQSMLARPVSGIHDLGGSPSKFQSEKKEIRLDREYLGAFSQTQLGEMRRIVGPAAALSGYA